MRFSRPCLSHQDGFPTPASRRGGLRGSCVIHEQRMIRSQSQGDRASPGRNLWCFGEGGQPWNPNENRPGRLGIEPEVRCAPHQTPRSRFSTGRLSLSVRLPPSEVEGRERASPRAKCPSILSNAARRGNLTGRPQAGEAGRDRGRELEERPARFSMLRFASVPATRQSSGPSPRVRPR